MARATSNGRCEFCGGKFSKAAMGAHLAGCTKRPAGNQALLPLLVEAVEHGGYWLHVEVTLAATLKQLDAVLREVWLECCGHMSSFVVAGVAYDSSLEDAPPGTKNMYVPVSGVLTAVTPAEYTYDFGSSTELKVTVLPPRLGKARRPVELVARNEPPRLSCANDRRPAKEICGECQARLCDECLAEHEDDAEFLLPVVNSPRTGVCAYGRP